MTSLRERFIFLSVLFFFIFGTQVDKQSLIAFEAMFPYFLVVFFLVLGLFDYNKFLDNTFLNHIMRRLTMSSNIYVLEMVLYLTHLRKIAFLVKEAETAMISSYLFTNLKKITNIAFDTTYKEYVIDDFYKKALNKSMTIKRESDKKGIRELEDTQFYNIGTGNKTIETIAFELSVTWTSINNRVTPRDRYVIDPNEPWSLYEIVSPLAMHNLIYLFRLLKSSNKHLDYFKNCPEGEYIIKEIACQPPYFYNWLTDMFTEPDDIQMFLWNLISSSEPYTDEELSILKFYEVDLNSIVCKDIKEIAELKRLDPHVDKRPMLCNTDNWMTHVPVNCDPKDEQFEE